MNEVEAEEGGWVREPYFETDSGSLYQGHVLDILKELPEKSIQCCVTSPPYWGLRDYGLESQIWDGDKDCQHKWKDNAYVRNTDKTAGVKQQTNLGSIGRDEPVHNQFCQKCNAWRGSLGLEPIPKLFVSHIVQIFREVRRVLKDDGVLWLNLGDSYASGGRGENEGNNAFLGKGTAVAQSLGPKKAPPGLKPKDLCGIPWRVAFALQADGWYLRQDIIWHKPNPMPESVTDRCTKAHEYIFLLSKSGKYFYDAEAVKEKAGLPTRRAASFRNGGVYTGGRSFNNSADKTKDTHGDGATGAGRNKRSVWTVATHPYKEAHFATFPEKLIEPCVLAGSRPGDTVLDPFFGAGTTGVVAYKHGRKFVGIELNPDYCEISAKRIEHETQQFKLFA